MIEIMSRVPGEEEKPLEWEGRQFMCPCSFWGRKDTSQGQRTASSAGQPGRGRAETGAPWGQVWCPCPLSWGPLPGHRAGGWPLQRLWDARTWDSPSKSLLPPGWVKNQRNFFLCSCLLTDRNLFNYPLVLLVLNPSPFKVHFSSVLSGATYWV